MASQAAEPVLVFTRRLNELGLRYMVTGGVASMLYGEPRLTLDVDLVLVLPREAIAGLARAFPGEEFYCPPPEVLAAETARSQRGHFNLIHHATAARADVYLQGGDPLEAWGLDRARVLEVDGETVPVAPPEYVILRKLEYHRETAGERHVRDIQAMLRVSGSDIDVDAIERWARERGLLELWQRIKPG